MSSPAQAPALGRAVRAGLVAGVLVPVLYFGAQAAAAPFFPDFNVARHTASLLGSNLSAQPAILNTGAALTGVAALLAAPALLRALLQQGVWFWLACVIALCSVSVGIASLWAAAFPLPDTRHNPGALAVGMFLAPFVALLAAARLPRARWLQGVLALNALAFLGVAALHAGALDVNLADRAGLMQRAGAVVMFLPLAVLCLWLLRRAGSGLRPS